MFAEFKSYMKSLCHHANVMIGSKDCVNFKCAKLHTHAENGIAHIRGIAGKFVDTPAIRKK